MATEKVYAEYMGFDSLVAAEITADTAAAYTTGEVFKLAPAGEIKKSTERDSATKSYDNQAYIIIKSEGEDTVELTTPILPLDIEAKINDSTYDTDTGVLINDGVAKTKYFAIGYRLLCSDNTYRYVWRLKGSFTLGDDEAKSKEGTDSNNTTITFTGVQTIHKFTKTGTVAKDMVADARDDKLQYDKWFDDVLTPDTMDTIKKAS